MGCPEIAHPAPTPDTAPPGARLTWGDGKNLVRVVTTRGVVVHQPEHAGAPQGAAEVGLPLGWVLGAPLIPPTRLRPGLGGLGGATGVSVGTLAPRVWRFQGCLLSPPVPSSHIPPTRNTSSSLLVAPIPPTVTKTPRLLRVPSSPPLPEDAKLPPVTPAPPPPPP